ncbi:hypothetical protein AN394_00807 [Pseudoalteromonas sp. P1-26]|uniref:hypothetical protein n=1 Tax=Pseudoalteromonas sp. P1-26 TaxID=1723759 RepID=UPI0006D67D48|nr:hypothetical protein [Pseudoalteromonas sp. P1-26]KPZ74348.1 hypothetical protein AN394_00807 [Pseudoalteromonas sp. P1-26]
MKLLLFILTPLCFVISSTVNAIVPNTEYYQSALMHITKLNEQLSKVEIALKTEKNKDIYLQLQTNIQDEIVLIQKRVALYKQIEQQNLIMYSSTHTTK